MSINTDYINVANRNELIYYKYGDITAKNESGSITNEIVDGNMNTLSTSSLFTVDLRKVYNIGSIKIYVTSFPVDVRIYVSSDDSSSPVSWREVTYTKGTDYYTINFTGVSNIRHIKIIPTDIASS